MKKSERNAVDIWELATGPTSEDTDLPLDLIRCRIAVMEDLAGALGDYAGHVAGRIVQEPGTPLYQTRLFLKLLLGCWRFDVLLADGGSPAAKYLCVLYSLLPKFARGAVIVQYDHFATKSKGLRRWLTRRQLLGAAISIVWSKRQVRSNSDWFDIPSDRLLFLPYKSNLSAQNSLPPVESGSYIFSGGNSYRDYATLVEAVRGLPVRVIISTNVGLGVDPSDVPDNVVVVSTREPNYTKLLAGSRLVVLVVREGLIRGAGEASTLDAMYMGKAIVAVDDVSADEYIDHGRTGFVMPAGDAARLRSTIEYCLEDHDRLGEIAAAGAEEVRKLYTHDHFVRRLLLVGAAVEGLPSR